MRGIIFLVVGLALIYLVVGFVRQVGSQVRSNPAVARYMALQVTLWCSAIVSLSQCLAVYRRVAGERPNPHPIFNGLWGIVCAAVLVVSFLTIGFFMYRDDCRKGNVKRKFALYEKFMGPEK
jgi:hypothetical protein